MLCRMCKSMMSLYYLCMAVWFCNYIGSSSLRTCSLRLTLKQISLALIELSDVFEFQPGNPLVYLHSLHVCSASKGD